MEAEPDTAEIADEIRSAAEIARRSLALFAAIGLSLRANRQEVLDWLTGNDLWKWLAPREFGFVDNPQPPRKQIINMSWQSERLIVLLWTLGRVEQLPEADEQCSPSVFQEILPPFADVSVQDFISQAKTRPENEIWRKCDEILNLHWEARDAKLKARKPRRPVDIEIIQERHHAINWATGYCGLSWDEVTADT